ncbi:MAG TPA: hypothetical protein VKE27_04955, partial [Candidatus Dormibacteraeota bacterium]|nr:hypothetical protein [Candidatus Dormibacteraeota bacterium]
GDVDFVGVEGHATRHQRDLVEAVRAPRAPPDADLQPVLLPRNFCAGLDSTRCQGVLTPMIEAGFGELYPPTIL